MARGELSREDALRLVDEIVGLGVGRVSDPTTTREFVERFFETQCSKVSESSASRYRVFSREFFEYVGEMANAPLFKVTPALIAEWRDHLLNGGLSAKTVTNHFKALRMSFAEAVNQQRIEKSPFDGIKKPVVHRGKSPKKAFTWEQFQELLKVTEGEWRVCILIGGYTGQRQQDVAKLDWTQVDFKHRVIVFKREKTDDELTVPMHDALRRGLHDWWIGQGRPVFGRVTPEIAAMPRTTALAFPAIFRFKVLPRIGIIQPYVKRARERGRTTSEYSFHSLRHMLSTQLNAVGVSAETRMWIVGHSDRRVSAGYTHAQLADAFTALGRLPNVPECLVGLVGW